MSRIRSLLPFFLCSLVLATPREEKLRQRAATIGPGSAITVILDQGKEVRGQLVLADAQSITLTTFRDNRIVQVEVPYHEMKGLNVRRHFAGGRVLNGFAYFGGLALLFAVLRAAATGGRAVIALTVLSATLLVQAGELSRVKRKAAETQLGRPVEVVRLNGEKIRGYLVTLSDEGVDVVQGGSSPRTIRFEEMKDIRDKRPAHWGRNLLAGYGILVVAFVVVSEVWMERTRK